LTAAGARAPVVVVGAGIAGLACARELADAGVPVRVREREPVVGGRLASEPFGGRPVDTGAAYFTVSDPGFAVLVERWRRAGLVREWTDTFVAYGPLGSRPAPGPMRWAAPGGLRSLAEELAAGLPVELGRPVGRVAPGPSVDGAVVAAVALALPGPQAVALLDPALAAAVAAGRDQRWRPALSVVLRFPRRCWPDFSGAFVNEHPVLAAVWDDGERRGDGAPVLVAHTTAAYARQWPPDPAGGGAAGGGAAGVVDAADAAGVAVERAVRDLLGADAPAVERYVRRWPYAQPEPEPGPGAAGPGAGGPGAGGPGAGGPGAGGPGAAGAYHLDGDGIGLAGDWYGTPRVQTAWCSGRALGRAIAARLGTSG
jgi:renalase